MCALQGTTACMRPFSKRAFPMANTVPVTGATPWLHTKAFWQHISLATYYRDNISHACWRVTWCRSRQSTSHWRIRRHGTEKAVSVCPCCQYQRCGVAACKDQQSSRDCIGTKDLVQARLEVVVYYVSTASGAIAPCYGRTSWSIVGLNIDRVQ